MVTDHRTVANRVITLLLMLATAGAAGCQSTVDPGRTMRPGSQRPTVVPPPGIGTPAFESDGPEFPIGPAGTGSANPETSGIERRPVDSVVSLPQTNDESARYHTVQAGDSWSKIAATYQVTVPQLTQANGLDDSTVLQPGQMLFIPTVTAP